jgi:hypothetical protein
VGTGGDPGVDRRHFFSGGTHWSFPFTSALFFRKRKQKHKDAQPGKDRGSDEACGRNFSARLKTCFVVSSDADQKEQKSQAD